MYWCVTSSSSPSASRRSSPPPYPYLSPAQDDLHLVLGRNPSHTDALLTLGDIEHKLGLLTQAVDTLQRVLHTPGIEPFTVRVMPVPPMSGAFKCQPVASHPRVYALVLAPLSRCCCRLCKAI